MIQFNIWKSDSKAPNTLNGLWLKKDKLLIYRNGKWESLFGEEDNTAIEPQLATVDIAGVMKKAVNVPSLAKDATKADIINKFNSLLVTLQAAGIME